MRASGISIRPAASADIAGVLRLWERARPATAVVPDTEDGIQMLLAQAPGSLIVAELEGEVVGTVIATWDGWRGNMYRLAVRTDCRRLGIGLQLVKAGEATLREQGVTRVTALVAVREAGAEALWGAAGYEHDKNVVRYVRDI